MTLRPVAASLLRTAAPVFAAQPRHGSLPQLRRQGSATQLIVDRRPFLIFGGEPNEFTMHRVKLYRYR